MGVEVPAHLDSCQLRDQVQAKRDRGRGPRDGETMAIGDDRLVDPMQQVLAKCRITGRLLAVEKAVWRQRQRWRRADAAEPAMRQSLRLELFNQRDRKSTRLNSSH